MLALCLRCWPSIKTTSDQRLVLAITHWLPRRIYARHVIFQIKLIDDTPSPIKMFQTFEMLFLLRDEIWTFIFTLRWELR